MHFLLWTKGFHQSSNFDTFKCSGENLANSSCYFPNHKSVFFANFALLFSLMKDNSSVIFYLKRYIIFYRQNSSNSSCQFWNNKSIPLQFFIILQCQHTKILSWWSTKGVLPYFQPRLLSEILTITNLWHAPCRVWTCTCVFYFGEKDPIKVPILTLSSALWKFAKFFMSFSISPVSFSSNITSFFSVMKDTPLSFLRSNTIKVQIFETFRCSGQNSSNSCHLWNNKSVLLQILHHSLVSWDITPLDVFSWNFIYFQQKVPIKVQIWWNFTWAIKSLKFCTLMGSFCPNHVQDQLKNYRRDISHDTEKLCKV